MAKSHLFRFGKTARRSKANASSSRPRKPQRGSFEMLEPRLVLSTAVQVNDPVLVSFNAADADTTTTYTAVSTDSNITATVLNTSLILKMHVHTVNADGSTGVEGEMDFLLLDDYAPNTIAHIQALVNQSPSFYNGLTFHRIVESFMIQGGDPLGTGTGGSGPNGEDGDVQDDELSVDLTFSTSGLLAMANSGSDTSDCQFFITAASADHLNYGYTILGKLVAGDDIRQALAAVEVEDNSSGETSKPVNAPIIDSIEIVSNTQYGLVMLKATTGGTSGEEVTVTVTASDGSDVIITGSDGTEGSLLDATWNGTFTPTSNHPAFVDDSLNVTGVSVTEDGEAVSFVIPVKVGDSSAQLVYEAKMSPSVTGLSVSQTSQTSKGGTITATGDIAGVYSLLIGVGEAAASGTTVAYDTQYIPVYVIPAAPTGITLNDSDIADGGTTSLTSGFSFTVTGVVSGRTVSIYVDDSDTPIGTAVATGDTVEIITTVAVTDGSHTFTAKQSVSYDATAIGNRTIEAGVLESVATAAPITFSVDSAPTASMKLSDLTISHPSGTQSVATIKVTYSNPGDLVDLATIVTGNILVTGPDGFSVLATLQATDPSSNSDEIVATYTFDAPSANWDSGNGGTYTIAMLSDQVKDIQGNPVAAGTLLTFNPVDIIAPTVTTLQPAADQANPTNGSTINFTVVFSEAVTGFDGGDVTIGGTAGATTAVVTGDGTTYNVAVSGMTGSGTVVLSLPAGIVKDAVGNDNLASTSTTNVVEYDVTGPTVTIEQTNGQVDPTSKTPIHFTVTFSEAVADFDESDVQLQFLDTFGATGTPEITVTPFGGSGTTFDVAVSGITGRGQLVATVDAGAAHDSVGNANTASTSTDNNVTFNYVGPVVTVGRAATQATRSSAATIHFTVTFDETVTDFSADDVTFGGTALGNLAAVVTGSGTTYDVAVTGMASTGTVVVTVAAGKTHDAVGNANSPSIGAENSVQFVLAIPPTFRLTAPKSITARVGQTIVVAWQITNPIVRTSVSLFYDRDKVWNGNQQALSMTTVQSTAKSGYSVYSWDTTGMAPGTYYVCGFLMSGKAIRSHLTQAITILPLPKATMRITAPLGQSYTAGQNVTEYWTTANAVAGSTISLCYDKDTVWNGNEKWIVRDHATKLNRYDSYTWNTTTVGMTPGKYYLAGSVTSNGVTTRTHLTSNPITVKAAPKPSFRVTAPATGTFTAGSDVTVYWSAPKAPADSTISLCYDTDTVFNGNEHWVQTNLTNSAMPVTSGYRSASWNTLGVAPGRYYVGGYLASNGTRTYSHLTQPITIAAAPALTVDDSAPRLTNASLLNEQQLQPIVAEAERRLAAAAGARLASALAGVTVRIVDLPGNTLGEAAGNIIYLDSDAAGYGWFVDATPADDREFSDPLGPYALAAQKGASASRVDLLTTVMHEMVHTLGLGHSDSLDLMAEKLLPGQRRTLNQQWLLPLLGQDRSRSAGDAIAGLDAIDQLFASNPGEDSGWSLT